MRRTLAVVLSLALSATALTPAAWAKKAKKAKKAASNVAVTVDDLRYPEMPQIAVPQPARHTLDNGMQVLIVEDHELPLVQAVAYIRTGDRLEPAAKVGLASLVGTVLRSGGTTSLPSDGLNERLENMAAAIETSIGTTNGSAFMSCLAEDFSTVLPIFADVLRNPAFEEDQLAVARTQAEAGIARQNDDPGQILGREFPELLYGEDSPYTRPATYDSIRSVTRDDLVAWHQAYFHPNNVLLALAGDFQADEALEAIRSAFGDWPRNNAEPADPPAVTFAFEPGVYYIEKNDVTQSNIRIGHAGVKRDHPDYYAIEVMNQVLGGGFAARLFSNVRSKKGLAYNVFGGVNSNWDYPGMFLMSLSTKTETTGAAIEALLEEARNMTAIPPTEDEVLRAKQGILNSFVFRADDTREILNQQLTYAYYGFPSDWMARYQKGIEAVTVEQVRKAAADHIDPDGFAILVVGPKDGTDRPLSDFGTVHAVDIAIPEPSSETVAVTAAGREAGNTLIAQAVAAIGGTERLAAVTGIRITGKSELTTPQGAFEIDNTSVTIFPDRQRVDLTLPFGTMTQVLAGEDSWMKSPQGMQPMPASMRESMAQNIRRSTLGLLRLHSHPDFVAVVAGEGDIGGTPVQEVQVQLEGDTVVLGIDPATGQVLSLVYQGSNPSGAPGTLRQVQSNFREVDGMTFAFDSEVTFDGEPMLVSRAKEIEIDPSVDEGTFARPE